MYGSIAPILALLIVGAFEFLWGVAAASKNSNVNIMDLAHFFVAKTIGSTIGIGIVILGKLLI